MTQKIIPYSVEVFVEKCKCYSEINAMLFDKQEANGFIYIDNNDILYHHIWKDGIHLNNEGIIVLAKNFIKKLNYGTTIWHDSTPPPLPESHLNENLKENNAGAILRSIKLNNINHLVIGHLNINSLGCKIEDLKVIVQSNLDIIIISETKIDGSFPTQQLKISGFSEPSRNDRNAHGGGVIIYVREDIPTKLLGINESNLEGIFLEINLRKRKWLLFGGYNNDKRNLDTFLGELTHVLA